MTAVLTTLINNFSWLAALSIPKSAVVYLSHNDNCAVAALMAARPVRTNNVFISTDIGAGVLRQTIQVVDDSAASAGSATTGE